ncbi:hypothetical protein COCVIDRAFT_94570 [Bipolaris victoriae FI3]|uniref:Lipocalin-like domain-containing protein n=2 Tax=Bipolaris TaxID=33194 RepID=W6YEC5_COCC2|nr:uncharacterized protein COCCADRAFT_34598 [Bipolaris zeicola 26-R-13]XP_014558412.1 hypothetical protein COCVIDRAFT_94570 [Bipolaris victoriae FI3]EUC36018.1 hypothetical protein COCCADRAFT_34598 [Bipolaris zeicola 26-R-13]
MASPANINIKNLVGRWTMNKSESDAFDPVLSLQGIGWLTRKAIGAATLTQYLYQSTVDGSDGVPTTHIKVDQFLTGGLKGSPENRTLDWAYREHSDLIFGVIKGRSRYSTLQKFQEESKETGATDEDIKYLIEGWLNESQEGDVIESFTSSAANKWILWNVWGFAESGGKRKLVKKFAVRNTDTGADVRVRLVYDYLGPLEE